MKDAVEEAQMRVLRRTLEAKRKRKDKEAGDFFSLKKLPSRFHPYLSESVSVTDNVDSRKNDKKSSIVNTFTPGFKMSLQDQKKSIAVDSHTNNEFTVNRRGPNAQSGQLDVAANFNLKRYVLSVSNNYYTNYFALEDCGVDDDEVDNYWRDTINLIVARNFNRIGFDLGYERTYTVYEPILKESNSIAESISFNQYLRVATKTKFLFGYSYGRTKYEHAPNPDNSHRNNFNLSLVSILLPKITASGEISYGLGESKLSDDTKDTTFSGKLSHMISKRSNLSLNLSHYIHEASTKSSQLITNSLQLSGNHRLAFNPKLNLSFSSGATYSRSPKKPGYEHNDEYYTLGLGLAYAFRQWLDFGIDWSYAKTESRANIDYHSNTFTFSSQAKF